MKRRGRKPVDVDCPKGYPYRLYDANGEYIRATSKADVKRLTSASVKLAKVTDLISANGHSKTAKILKNYGDRWICRDGFIFYSQ